MEALPYDYDLIFVDDGSSDSSHLILAELAEIAERIQNTISLFRKIACVLAVIIAVAFIFFHVRKDYNNYAGSQLVTAEVINVEGASDKNISVTYRYNIAGKEYESNIEQYT